MTPRARLPFEGLERRPVSERSGLSAIPIADDGSGVLSATASHGWKCASAMGPIGAERSVDGGGHFRRPAVAERCDGTVLDSTTIDCSGKPEGSTRTSGS